MNLTMVSDNGDASSVPRRCRTGPLPLADTLEEVVGEEGFEGGGDAGYKPYSAVGVVKALDDVLALGLALGNGGKVIPGMLL